MKKIERLSSRLAAEFERRTFLHEHRYEFPGWLLMFSSENVNIEFVTRDVYLFQMHSVRGEWRTHMLVLPIYHGSPLQGDKCSSLNATTKTNPKNYTSTVNPSMVPCLRILLSTVNPSMVLRLRILLVRVVAFHEVYYIRPH